MKCTFGIYSYVNNVFVGSEHAFDSFEELFAFALAVAKESDRGIAYVETEHLSTFVQVRSDGSATIARGVTH